MKRKLIYSLFILFSIFSCADDVKKLNISDFTINTNLNNYSFSLNESINDFYQKTNYLSRNYTKQFNFITGGILNQEMIAQEIKERMGNYNYSLPIKGYRVEMRQYPILNLYLFSERIDWIIVCNTKENTQLEIIEDPLLKNPVTTTRRIRIGDTMNDLISVYGQPQNKEEKDPNNLLMMYYLNDPTPFSVRYEMVYVIKEGKVHMILLSNVYKDEFKRKDTDFSVLVNGQRISLADPFEKVTKSLGKPDRTEFKDSKWDKGDLIYSVYKGVSFMCFRGQSPKILQIKVDLADNESSRGIRVGDSKDKVISIYGDDYSEEGNSIRYKLNYKGEEIEVSHFQTTYFLYFYFNEKNEVKLLKMEEEIPED